MAEQYETIVVTDPVTAEEHEMIQTNFGAHSRRGERWYQCVICTFSYPASEVIFVDGAPYCARYQHYRDALVEKSKGKIRASALK